MYLDEAVGPTALRCCFPRSYPPAMHRVSAAKILGFAITYCGFQTIRLNMAFGVQVLLASSRGKIAAGNNARLALEALSGALRGNFHASV
jgi:hypothetical protein